MPFFKRRAAPVDTNTTAATGTHEKTKGPGLFGRHGQSHAMESEHTNPVGSLNKRPPFGQWLKATWVDVLTMIILGAIGLGVYKAPPAPSRSFPVYFADGEVVYPEFAYPLRNEIIPIWAAAMLAALVPIVVFLFVQIRVRSFWDVNNAVLGLLYSLITAAVFQVFLKWLIGGLRPHFLAVCKPNITPESLAVFATAAESPATGYGFSRIMFDRKICTGDENQINDALESFPSGHTTAAFAGFVFLSLYLNAKLKLFSNHHPAMWKLVAVYAPILGAVLIGGALTIDEFHNWYDVFAGAVIGTTFAFSAYRMVYAAIWDWRVNHIPLVRGVPFPTRMGDHLEGPVFTHKAGWANVGTATTTSVGHGHGHNNMHAPAVHGNGAAGTPRRSSGVERRPVGGYGRNEQMV